MRRIMGAATLLALVCLFFGLTTCSNLHTLLLTLESKEKVDKLQYRVTDLDSGEVIYSSPKQTITRDISKSGEGLRVAVEFASPGRYLVQVLARGTRNHFFAGEYNVDGVAEETAVLGQVGTNIDADGDGVPACGAASAACTGAGCNYLDCKDGNSSVHPFAKEDCGDKVDNDCSAGCDAAPGKGDDVCVDADGDGDPSDKDCDDTDPCRSTKLKEKPHTCKECPDGMDAADFPVVPKACLDKLKKAGKTLKAPYCGDGIDQDCDGKDTACITDNDCDCYPASDDCDDTKKNINKGQKEVCGDNIDNNCDGNKDEGCISCDIDGDGHALPGTTDKKCVDMPKDDHDDYDAGKHPGTTKNLGGMEGGHVYGALRQWCSFTERSKNSTVAKPEYERDVDHDGDTKIASKDGCPSAACDADGDGFQNKSCNPPLSKTDCDDTNAQIFPGAPDKCGDGIVQNCASDNACPSITDADKDGYSSKDDCNDADPNVRPWGTEKCDGKDNDCDGLIDEGNPDNTGKKIRTNVSTCNDDNDGECAKDCKPGTAECSPGGNKLSGICACSSQSPNSKRDESDRVKCSGENLKAKPSQRCFGATQPDFEQCDKLDRDCNEKNDDPTGVNLKEKGKPCSTSTGTCKAGKVIGCDLSKKVPNEAIVVAVMKKHGITYNPHWICSSETLYPIPEVCDGRDDDCDGVSSIQDVVGVDVGSTELDEKDVDKDKYMACGPNCYGTGRTSLATGLKGCGDCDEKSSRKASTYPGAIEQCNNWDDNCKNGVVDDGKDVCPVKGAGWKCCSAATPPACKATLTDKVNCGTCGKVCDTRVADSCVGGKCVCGTTGSACKNGLNCESGKCVCVSGKQSMCTSGCCDGTTTCRFFIGATSGSQSASKCGYGGQQCKSCDDKNDCTTDTCSKAGKCGSANLPNSPATSCNSKKGRCWDGACCLGCIGGGKCQAGSAVTYCGLGGISCSACTSGTQCKADVCSSGKCTLSNKPSTTTCNDGLFCTVSDKCSAGICKGTSRDCSGKTDDCNTGVCSESTDKCIKKAKADLTACKSKTGLCYSGACCTGCYDSGSKKCRAGTATTGCGKGGKACATCSPSSNPCQVASCSTTTGKCGYVFKGLQAACKSSGKNGQCYDSSNPTCCTDCWDSTSGTCKAGTAVSACGTGGYACQTCTAPNGCKTATCTSNKCGSTNKTDKTSCASGKGKCYSGICCQYCHTGSYCASGSGFPMCGTGGAMCTNCTSQGAGTCNTSTGVCTCTGCWKSNGTLEVCYPGTANKACGSKGGKCVDCTTSSQTCNKTTFTCG